MWKNKVNIITKSSGQPEERVTSMKYATYLPVKHLSVIQDIPKYALILETMENVNLEIGALISTNEIVVIILILNMKRYLKKSSSLRKLWLKKIIK